MIRRLTISDSVLTLKKGERIEADLITNAHKFNLPWICNEVFTKVQKDKVQRASGLVNTWRLGPSGALEKHRSPMTLFTYFALWLLFRPWVMSDSLPPRTAVQQTPLSSTISQSLLRFTSTESVILFNHLILHHPFSFCLQSFPGSGPFPISRLLHIRCLLSLVAQMVKGLPAVQEMQVDPWVGKIPGWGRSPGEGKGNPVQYSCLENSTDRGT